jgi:topoisomerase-4 subunit B
VVVRDNGRGIPVDPHPKFPGKSALEVILTTLHSGGKFGGKAYETSGGLHGVGVSVVNALSAELEVEVARNRQLFAQTYRQGQPQGPLRAAGAAPNRRGTTLAFTPDPEIFGEHTRFRPEILHRMARSKAYLFRGVEIRWRCAPELAGADVPAAETFRFPAGLADFLKGLTEAASSRPRSRSPARRPRRPGQGRVGGGLALGRGALRRLLLQHGPHPAGRHPRGGPAQRAAQGPARARGAERVQEGGPGRRRGRPGRGLRPPLAVLPAAAVPGPDEGAAGQPGGDRLVEGAVRDRFELWLGSHPAAATALLNHVTRRAEERLARRKAKEEVGRKTATRKLRLPGKLADCAREARDGTEIFIVEGDSAGGSAKQARNRDTQAILPLRGKILNVASAAADRLDANRELQDLVIALGCGAGKHFRGDDLRYEKVVVMTDADVDGAHIAALLMTFFFKQLPS